MRELLTEVYNESRRVASLIPALPNIRDGYGPFTLPGEVVERFRKAISETETAIFQRWPNID